MYSWHSETGITILSRHTLDWVSLGSVGPIFSYSHAKTDVLHATMKGVQIKDLGRVRVNIFPYCPITLSTANGPLGPVPTFSLVQNWWDKGDRLWCKSPAAGVSPSCLQHTSRPPAIQPQFSPLHRFTCINRHIFATTTLQIPVAEKTWSCQGEQTYPALALALWGITYPATVDQKAQSTVREDRITL